jgi:hypothetical protein
MRMPIDNDWRATVDRLDSVGIMMLKRRVAAFWNDGDTIHDCFIHLYPFARDDTGPPFFEIAPHARISWIAPPTFSPPCAIFWK